MEYQTPKGSVAFFMFLRAFLLLKAFILFKAFMLLKPVSLSCRFEGDYLVGQQQYLWHWAHCQQNFSLPIAYVHLRMTFSEDSC